MEIVFHLLCYVVMGALAGLVFGGIEASWTIERRSTGQKLPHAALLAGRVVASAVLGAGLEFFFGGTYIAMALATGIVFVSLILIHRLEYNFSVGAQFFYMGPVSRSGGDSIYDSAMWGISRWWADITRTDHSPQDVFAVAVTIELLSLGTMMAFFVGQSA